MIISESKKDVAVCGNFKTSGFKIQASSKAFDILSSNIYTHKVRAVVREISCNAVDSHKAAGTTTPIKVHLPTTLEPHFAVRDYGTGLSDEDVREIFTTYFCSTKTSSNDFVGALGLGSKSPFCLVDSFTVTSFYNGAKSLYSCYRDENGEPQVALLTTEDTDEFNGVEVSLSVENHLIQEFANEAEYVYQYFDQMPNINKQSIIDNINEYRNKIILDTEDVCVMGWHGWHSVKAVMGGVAYDIPDIIENHNFSGYLKFKMGEISFDAGRESLSLDEKTVNAIKAKFEVVEEKLREAVIYTINSEPTPFLKAKKSMEMTSAPGIKTADLITFELPKTTTSMEYYAKTSSWKRSSVDKGETTTLPLGNSVRYFRHKPRFSTRIKEYLKDTVGTIVLLTDKQIAETQIDLNVLEDLETEIPKIERVTRSGRSYQKQAGVMIYNGSTSYKSGERWDEAIDIPVSEKVYVEIHRNEPVGSSFSKIDLAESMGITVYGVKKAFMNSKAFQAGNWISLHKYMERCYKKMIDETMFDADLSNWNHRNIRDRLVAARSDGHKFDCETVNNFLDKNDLLNSVKNGNLRRIAETFYWEIKEDKGLDKAIEDVIMKHPMIEFFEIGHRQSRETGQKVLADYLNRN
jgi:hypothetical protein